MKTYCKHELSELGAEFPFTMLGFDGVLRIDRDRCLINGIEFVHEANDYQDGQGTYDDYKLYRMV